MSVREKAGQLPLRVGVIADTHGLLRPQVLEVFRGVDHILHAGDVGSSGILEKLRTIAPLTAVRGNIDTKEPCSRLPATETVELAEQTIYMLHDRGELNLDPAAAGFAAVVSGHSHQPGSERVRGVLYFNPGSAGPRRFSLPVSLGLLTIHAGGINPEFIELDP